MPRPDHPLGVGGIFQGPEQDQATCAEISPTLGCLAMTPGWLMSPLVQEFSLAEAMIFSTWRGVVKGGNWEDSPQPSSTYHWVDAFETGGITRRVWGKGRAGSWQRLGELFGSYELWLLRPCTPSALPIGIDRHLPQMRCFCWRSNNYRAAPNPPSSPTSVNSNWTSLLTPPQKASNFLWMDNPLSQKVVQSKDPT